MTVSELYSQVAQLGFEDSLEDENRFIFAANRALLQVAALRPAISSCVINHKPMANLLSESVFSPIERCDDLCFEATDAKAYYFEADGNGVAFIEAQGASGDWEIVKHIEMSSGGRFISYRGFILRDGEFFSGRVRIRFSGEYLYSVKNVALYRYLYSANHEDVPAYEPYTRYDIGALAADFLSLVAPPIEEDSEGERLSGNYDVEDGRIILLPYNIKGCYKVLYRRRPKAIVQIGEGEVIDLDEELCTLLPTLVASYVWAEDEPSLAQYYLTLYRERALDLERRIVNHAPVAIKNTSGW